MARMNARIASAEGDQILEDRKAEHDAKMALENSAKVRTPSNSPQRGTVVDVPMANHSSPFYLNVTLNKSSLPIEVFESSKDTRRHLYVRGGHVEGPEGHLLPKQQMMQDAKHLQNQFFQRFSDQDGHIDAGCIRQWIFKENDLPTCQLTDWRTHLDYVVTILLKLYAERKHGAADLAREIGRFILSSGTTEMMSRAGREPCPLNHEMQVWYHLLSRMPDNFWTRFDRDEASAYKPLLTQSPQLLFEFAAICFAAKNRNDLVLAMTLEVFQITYGSKEKAKAVAWQGQEASSSSSGPGNRSHIIPSRKAKPRLIARGFSDPGGVPGNLNPSRESQTVHGDDSTSSTDSAAMKALSEGSTDSTDGQPSGKET
jgi:hypothetical protein